MNLSKWFLKIAESILPARRLIVLDADTPPERLPWRNIVLARENNEDWAVAFKCPCGCGKRLELMLIEEASPKWSLSVNAESKPTLHPSIWLKADCRSHFWLKNGKVVWC
jgi:hypothetical protein